MSRVLLTSFSADYTNPVSFTESLVPLMLYSNDVEKASHVDYRHFARTPIHIARRRAADAAIEGEYAFLCMVDNDQTFHSGALDRLLAHDVEVVSALAYQRVPPYEPCTFTWAIGDTWLHVDIVKHNEARGLRRVDGTGFPFTLIRTSVLRTLRDSGKDWFGYWRDSEGRECGEDAFFMARCRDAGIPVHVDTSLVVGHLGPPPVVDEKTYRDYKEAAVKKAMAEGGMSLEGK